MRYYALATDYDGTIASNGRVPERTLEAMRQLQASGRKLILVTGRELPDLFGVFPHADLFDRIVAENGALLYRPAAKDERPLAEPPPAAFADLLRERGIAPLSIGRVIVATVEPNDTPVLQCIRQLGLELQVIFNKGAVMILPSGVNKATGLAAALEDMGLSAHNVVGVGDAENDHAFLESCECSAAVANALPALKSRADILLERDHGDGVAELIDHLLADDLRSVEPKLARHSILLGLAEAGREIKVLPCGANWLVAGSSGGGKSTLAQGFLEKLFERNYQACVFDSTGVYTDLPKAVVLGQGSPAPSAEGLTKALSQPQAQFVINMSGVKPPQRAALMHELLSALASIRQQSGRPHWVVLDDALELLSPGPVLDTLLRADFSLLFVTAHPKALPPAVAPAVQYVIATGTNPIATLGEFCSAIGAERPELPSDGVEPGESLVWNQEEPGAIAFRPVEPAKLREQHARV